MCRGPGLAPCLTPHPSLAPAVSPTQALPAVAQGAANHYNLEPEEQFGASVQDMEQLMHNAR